MTRKKGKTYEVHPPQKEKAFVIDMNRINRQKAYHAVTFRTGSFMTEKSRPRKKNWMKELSSTGGGGVDER